MNKDIVFLKNADYTKCRRLPVRNYLPAAAAQLLLRRTIFIRLRFAHVHSHRDLGYGAVWSIKSKIEMLQTHSLALLSNQTCEITTEKETISSQF